MAAFPDLLQVQRRTALRRLAAQFDIPSSSGKYGLSLHTGSNAGPVQPLEQCLEL